MKNRWAGWIAFAVFLAFVSATATNYVSMTAFNSTRTKQNKSIRDLKSRVAALEKFHSANPPASSKPVGVGPYLAPGGSAGEFSNWVERSTAKGASVIRVIPLASSWSAGLKHPFKLVGGKYDITQLDQEWLENFKAGLAKAKSNSVFVLVDIFDEVGLEAADRQARHPFNALNNIHGDAPTPGVAYSTTDPGRAKVFKQQIEHALKQDWEGNAQTFHFKLKAYVQNLLTACKDYDNVIWCVGNETESRAVERNVFAWMEEVGETDSQCINGTYLYGSETGYDLVEKDSEKRYLFSTTEYIRIHHLKPSTVDAIYNNLDYVFTKYPSIKVIGDSDGAGSGSIRGQNGRPTFEEEYQAMLRFFTLGSNTEFWIAKILDDADGYQMLDTLTR